MVVGTKVTLLAFSGMGHVFIGNMHRDNDRMMITKMGKTITVFQEISTITSRGRQSFLNCPLIINAFLT